MHRLLLVAFVAGAALQNPEPQTDVFLATFTAQDGRVTIGKPANISRNRGYDNQPSFTPDGRAVLFTCVRGDRKPDPANRAQTGSDVCRYDVASGQLSQITTTAESEYSPTVTPDAKHFSVIQVEADGTQRLWKFPLAGGSPALVLADVKPVGYHAWADGSTVALFVLGEPPTLQLADVTTGKADVVAKNIGRSVLKIPGGGISFVQRAAKDGATTVTVMQIDPKSRQTIPLVRVMPGILDPHLAWTPDGILLTTHAGKLYGWKPGDADFGVLADLDALGLRGASRLAVSTKGDRIAIVAEE